MKRKLWVAIMISSFVGICFTIHYSGNVWHKSEQDNQVITYEQESKQPDGFESVSIEGKEIVNADSYIKMYASMKYPADTDSQYKYAEEVIQGKIVGTEYFVFESIPWTQLKIECLDKFKGDLLKGDVVTIYVMGGYIEAGEYKQEYGDCSIEEDVLVEMDFYQNELSNSGDEGIFFLVKNDKDSMFTQDTYSFLCSGYSKFMYDDKNDDIQVYNESEEIEIRDQKEFMADMKKRKRDH